jgi:hypothetical protein
MALAAVDCDPMTARSQARGKLLGKRLEPAIIGRNAAGTENRDSNVLALTAGRRNLQPLAALERAKAGAVFCDLLAGALTGT